MSLMFPQKVVKGEHFLKILERKQIKNFKNYYQANFDTVLKMYQKEGQHMDTILKPLAHNSMQAKNASHIKNQMEYKYAYFSFSFLIISASINQTVKASSYSIFKLYRFLSIAILGNCYLNLT